MKRTAKNRNKIITFVYVNSQQYMFLLLFGEGGLLVSGGTRNDVIFFIIPCHTKSGRVLCYTLRTV